VGLGKQCVHRGEPNGNQRRRTLLERMTRNESPWLFEVVGVPADVTGNVDPGNDGADDEHD
jgi:hypothetical protein